MRTLRLLLISLVLAATGCPNSDSSTPPVTGLVLGGPTLGGGGGVVSVEVSTAVAGTTVMLENLTRGTQPASTVADSSVPFVTVSIAADVADRLRVSFTDLVQGPVTAEVTVPSPRIVEIRDINESAPVVHAGAAAQITGEGFSADPNAAGAVSNVVSFDGLAVQASGQPGQEARPGLLFFQVPAGAQVGPHTVMVGVAGQTPPADPSAPTSPYVSAPFTVTVAAP